MINQITAHTKLDSGRARGVISTATDGYPFIIGLAIATLSDKVEVGQGVGMIQFGSRVDSCFPDVKAGDKVVAGKTISIRKKVDGAV